MFSLNDNLTFEYNYKCNSSLNDLAFVAQSEFAWACLNSSIGPT